MSCLLKQQGQLLQPKFTAKLELSQASCYLQGSTYGLETYKYKFKAAHGRKHQYLTFWQWYWVGGWGTNLNQKENSA